MRSVVILGTGGGALDLLDIIDAVNRDTPSWVVAGFLDDAKEGGALVWNLPVLGRLRDASHLADASFINAIGSDRSFRNRPGIIAGTEIAADSFITLVHPLASVSSRARIGRGVSVGPGATIGGGVTIDDHVTICPGAIIGHDSTIGEYSIIAPGAVVSGGVQIEPAGYIGAGAVVRQQLRIGKGALVGMGAVVVHDVAPGTTVVGNPARLYPSRNF